MNVVNAFRGEEEQPTILLNLSLFVSPWSLTESGLCAATNNVSRQKPLTRIYICDGVMGLLVVLCLWLIDCRGHLSLKSLYRPCVVWRVDDLKLSFYCAVELIDLSPSLYLFSFVLLSCLLSRSLNVHWVMKCVNHWVTQHCRGSSVKDGRAVRTLIEFKVELKGDEKERIVSYF